MVVFADFDIEDQQYIDELIVFAVVIQQEPEEPVSC